MDKIKQFIKDFKEEYGIEKNYEVLDCIQSDGQHQFLIRTQGTTIKEAEQILIQTEEYLTTLLELGIN